MKGFIAKCYNEAKDNQEFSRLDRDKNIDHLIAHETKGRHVTVKGVEHLIRELYTSKLYDLANETAKQTTIKAPTAAIDLRDGPQESQIVETRGDYSDFYRRMKVMAKDKGMDDKSLQELLANRTRGEKAYDLVSNDTF